jgi:tetratricopeptide (TPR) repeat protein
MSASPTLTGNDSNNQQQQQKELSSEEIAQQLIQEGIQHYHSEEAGSYEKARISFESARDVAKAGGCDLQEARALGNLANAYSNLNENIQASDLYRLSIFLFKKLGENKKEAIILKNAANVERELKNWDEAIRLHRRRITICEKLVDDTTGDMRQESVEFIKVCQLEYQKETEKIETKKLQLQIEKLCNMYQNSPSGFKQCHEILEKIQSEVLPKCISGNYTLLEGIARFEIAKINLILHNNNNDSSHSTSTNKNNNEKTAAASNDFQQTYITEIYAAIAIFEKSGVENGRLRLMDAFDDLTAFYILNDKNKEAIKILEKKVRCFNVKNIAERDEMEEVINRINKMRADMHAVQLGAPGVISPELNPSEKSPISVAEERLRRAELSAKRHREMMQLTFKDIPIQQIEKRIVNAESSMGQLSPFIKANSQAELSCSKAIRESMGKSTFAWAGVEKASFNETGTLRVALESFKGHMARTSNLKKRFGEEIIHDVVQPLETSTKGVSSFLKSQVGQRKKQEHVVNAAVERVADVKNKVAAVEASANRLRKQVDNLSVAERSSITNPIVTRQRRKNQELSEMGDLMQMSTMEFERCKTRAIEVKERLADEYQRHELKRVSTIRDRLLQFVDIEEEHLKNRLNMLKRFKNTVQAIDPTSDLRLFTHDQKVRTLCGGEWRSFNADYATGIDNADANDNATRQDKQEKYALENFIKEIFLATSADALEKNVTVGLRDEINRLLEKERNRKLVIRLMNIQRSKRQDVGPGFNLVVDIMNVFLDKCVQQNDVKGGKMMMIMSETFFRFRKHTAGKSKGGEKIEKSNTREMGREYLQESIKNHRIWENPHFWEEAFFLSVREEVVKHLKQVHDGSVNKESNFAEFYKNILFGQLGSYALNMLNFGVTLEVTLSFIRKLCVVNRIGDDKRMMLIENAKMVRNN